MKNVSLLSKMLLIGFLVFLNALFITSAIAAEKIYPLSTASSGVVSSIFVKTGEQVKQGQLLLQLDQRVFKARFTEAEAKEKSLLLDRQEAEKELQRAEELYERTVLSDHELDVAKIHFAKVNSAYHSAIREKIESQYMLDHSQLLAPAAGKIKRMIAFPGMVVNNQMKITILIELATKK